MWPSHVLLYQIETDPLSAQSYFLGYGFTGVSDWKKGLCMFGCLLRKEILNHIQGFRFLLLAIMGAAIIWLSLFSGYRYYRDNLAEYREGQALTEDHIRHLQNLGSLVRADNPGHPIQKPPTPMSIFVRGLEPTLGRVGYVAGGDIQRLKFSPVAEEPILGIVPPLDLMLVVQVILSLFVLLLTYDTISGEKEEGTLRLTGAFPVPRYDLLLSKIVGALIPTFVAFGLPLLLGTSVVFLLPDVQFSSYELQRLAIVLVVFGIYLLTIICAGVLGSALTRRTATSFVILLFFWVGIVAVIPRLSLILAGAFRPAPSTQQYEADRGILNRAGIFKRFGRQREWHRNYREKTGRAWFETPEGIEARTHMRVQYAADARTEFVAQVEKLTEAFQNRYDSHLDLAMGLAGFSPAFALNRATIRRARSHSMTKKIA